MLHCLELRQRGKVNHIRSLAVKNRMGSALVLKGEIAGQAAMSLGHRVIASVGHRKFP
jgi:hypothetical protein